MKIPTPSTKVSITSVAIGFLAGGIVVFANGQPAPKKTLLNDQRTATVSQTTTPTDPTTSSPSTPAPTGTTLPTDTTSGSSTPTGSNSTGSAGTSSTPTSSSAPQTTQTTQQVQAPAPVTVVSATLGNWTNQGPNSVTFDTEPNGKTYSVQYQYCSYTYSDSSTKQVEYQTRELWNDGSITNVTYLGTTCDISNAPSPN